MLICIIARNIIKFPWSLDDGVFLLGKFHTIR